MGFGGEDRAVTVQIGAVLIFGFLIISMSVYQATVVPEDNKAVEFEHNDEVQTDLQELRNAVVRAGSTGERYPVSVRLGTRYPQRTMFVNPPPASGSLSTETLGAVYVNNSKAADPEVRDYWEGSQSFDTNAFVYEPRYSRYDEAPTTRYEHTVLYNSFDNGANLSLTDQAMVDGRRISLVTLAGDYEQSSSGTVSVDPNAVSASETTVTIRDDGGPVTLRIPTTLSESAWNEVLEDELSSVSTTTHHSADFEGGTLASESWTHDPGDADAAAGVNENTSNSGNHSAYHRSGAGSIVSPDLDTSAGSQVVVDYWVRKGDDAFSENPDVGTNEDLFVEYRNDAGNWVQIDKVDADEPDGTIVDESKVVSASDATHPNFAVRFRQEGASSTDGDYWHVDDVTVKTQSGSGEGYVTGVDYDATGDPNVVTLTLQQGIDYQLSVANVGLGSDAAVTEEPPAYVVPVRGDGAGVSANDERKVTVEVRDRFNNPVSGALVNTSGVPDTRLAPSSAKTGSDGRVTFTYTAPDPVVQETFNLTIDDNSSAAERATFTMNPTNDPGTSTLTWETAADWDAGSGTNVVHETRPNTGWSDETLRVGYTATDSDLVSYWSLDESSGATKDVAGTHDGTTKNGVLQGQTGVFGTAASEFDGASSRVDIDDNMDVSGSEMTISLWVNADTWEGTANDMRFVSKTTSSSNSDHYWMFSEAQDQQLRFRLKTGGSTTKLVAPSGTSLTSGTWIHAVATYDGSQMRIYKNGNEVASTSKSGNIDTSTSVPVALGSNPQDFGTLDGRLDEVRIYDRALSQSEIDDLYDARNGGSYTSDWKEGSLDASNVELKDVTATLPSGTGIDVYVEMDTDGDGSVDDTSSAVALDGSGGPYSVSGLSGDAQAYRLRVEFTNTETSSATFGGATIEG
ncbi:LamG-like jellyroll fold domain-containing protein [Halogeometricum limi]|uniref:Concanavalin A-like lectin/glucanases superfamily protein n=1 Tax=Halogeometricum limi TaxID=555875 RepID=A0A1I6I551_9EURY|nr:LamG-like jellyroll fold domain-containing protein [Halogeometricum limi]SFR61831.1 Concanavalin A-like lectin/glucanases superfamily protein [Halogeometricum limi]